MLATEFGVRLSVGRTGQCWDNALAESFFATVKRELLDTSPWPSRAAARTAIFDFDARSLTTTPMVSVKRNKLMCGLARGMSRPT
ncbi:integrase core domain-containing protein [Streptomyces sp. Root369]|uniref:integrase core domain-containing protein n=1 Tax=Streptomyces sp. Root369 TaxID=1736523 RepID=UPI0007C86148|nr:integrase core domain-containing protein [Streptomyces sp. Root369]